MAPPWVFALYFRARLSALFDHQIRAMTLHDSFDLRFFMSWDDDEAGDVRGDPVVLRWGKLDRLHASLYSTFAMKRKNLIDAVVLRALFNPLVHGSKDLFVPRRCV